MTTSTDYKRGQLKFSDWMRSTKGVKLHKVEYQGIGRLEDGNDKPWDHHAWKMWVGSTHMPASDSYGVGSAKTFEFDFRQGMAHDKAPKLYDLMGCLFADVQGLDQDFEDWARDLGYDPDSRKALKIFEDCLAESQKLRALFGEPDLDKLLAEARPYIEEAGL